MDELATWRIPADLAVLAACETARGRVVAGEGVLGFPRAFFLAGVPRVVVSPWRVSDETAGPLLQRFHALVAKDGLAPGAALRQAQLERLKAGGPLAHPYHWAGFMLWGLPD
jgi:CHAT domain-containing protein